MINCQLLKALMVFRPTLGLQLVKSCMDYKIESKNVSSKLSEWHMIGQNTNKLPY
ncbi:23880_t:CDS:2 [Gigaspora rosea]|nr:23880_t:CDS:2 [Gigaspora rosea]